MPRKTERATARRGNRKPGYVDVDSYPSTTAEDAATNGRPVEGDAAPDPREREDATTSGRLVAGDAAADPPLRDYDEEYLDDYATDREGNETYATKRTRDEFYLCDPNGRPLKMARSRRDTGRMAEYRARDRHGRVIHFVRDGEPVPPVDEDENVLVVEVRYATDGDGNEVYDRDGNGNESYRSDWKETEVPARKADGKEYYARKKNARGEVVDFLPTRIDFATHRAVSYLVPDTYPVNHTLRTIVYRTDDEQNEVYYEDVDGLPFYGRDPLGHEAYAIDRDGREVYLPSRGYARKSDGSEFYAYRTAIDGERIEYPLQDPDTLATRYVLDANGEKRYPRNRTTGRPVYEKDPDDDETYFKDGLGDEYYAQDERGEPVYARRKDGRERLPRFHDGSRFYANNAAGKQVYPRDARSGEYYLRVGNVEMAIDDAGVRSYAKNETGDEIYPRVFVEEGGADAVVDPNAR